MTKEHTAEKEFKNPKEHKDLGAFPPPGQNGEFNAPFFVFDYPFPVGPCVFHICTYESFFQHFIAKRFVCSEYCVYMYVDMHACTWKYKILRFVSICTVSIQG